MADDDDVAHPPEGVEVDVHDGLGDPVAERLEYVDDTAAEQFALAGRDMRRQLPRRRLVDLDDDARLAVRGRQPNAAEGPLLAESDQIGDERGGRGGALWLVVAERASRREPSEQDCEAGSDHPISPHA